MLCYTAHTQSLGEWLSVNPKDQNRRCKIKYVYINKLEIRHTGHYKKTGFHLAETDLKLNLFALQKSYRDLREVLQYLPRLANKSSF